MKSMERMPAMAIGEMTDDQRKAHQEVASGPRGAVYGPFVALLRSPELMSRLQKVGEYLRYNNSLPRNLVEFTILHVARQWTQQVEWHLHHPLALKEGVKPEIAQALAEGRRPDGMSEDEEIAYEFSRELGLNKGVSDETYRRATARFGEHGVIDLIGLNGYYSLLSMVMNVARTPPPGGVIQPLERFPV